jgi:hypothetical protein
MSRRPVLRRKVAKTVDDYAALLPWRIDLDLA